MPNHERDLGALLRLVEPGLVDHVGGTPRRRRRGEQRPDGTTREPDISALCELNHTPQKPDGTIDAKAISINERGSRSPASSGPTRTNGILTDVRSFLNAVPHVSFACRAPSMSTTPRRRQETPDPTRCSPRWSSSTIPTSSPAGCR